MSANWRESLEEAIGCGMAFAHHAARRGDATAVVSPYGERTFAELNGNANRLARLMRANGIGEGDAVAVVTRNRPAFVETYLAAMRSGVRFTPVNFHLTAEEAGYIIDNCEAKLVVFDASLGSANEALGHAPSCGIRLAVGGDADGFDSYETAIAAHADADVEDPVRGSQMLYTSGTTGRPKGVYRRQQPVARSSAQSTAAWNPETDMCLCTGPAYHAAPLAFNVVSPLNAGVGVVFMDKWDAEETLRLIEAHRVTHTHMVATMFHRLLALPAETKSAYDISSLRYLLHGAAPCPVPEKQAMIDWLGPIIYEYYAATEGGGNFFIGPEEWLAKPGSVGKSPMPENTKIVDDDGNPVAQGETGVIYFKAPAVGRFEYFKAPDKTNDSYRGDWFTLGDMGYLDEDGYLFLNGRSAETIISGGVNIYPQEIDDKLLEHPAVLDVCTIGVPNDEWGEEVRSVVLPKPEATPGSVLADELIAFARTRLPGFKVPRAIDFVTDLPRLPSGKIQRRLVRAPYWAGRTKQI